MSKVKLLTVAVVVLVLLNIGTLAISFMGKPGHPGPLKDGGPKTVVIERLHFDADQVKAYELLIAKHRGAISDVDKELLETRNHLYKELLSSEVSGADSLFSAIGAIQQRAELVHFAHFGDIRVLCHPDQLPAFDALVDDLASYFSHGPGKGGPGTGKP